MLDTGNSHFTCDLSLIGFVWRFILFKLFSPCSSSSSSSSCSNDKRVILLSLLIFKDETAKLIRLDSIELWNVILYIFE